MVALVAVTVALAGQLLLAGAAVTRLRRGPALTRVVARHGVLPARIRRPWVLAGVEAVQLGSGPAGGVAVLAGDRAAVVWLTCCAAAAGLYTAFAVYLYRLMRIRGRVPCGCLGDRERVGPPAIARAVVFAVAAVTVSVGRLPAPDDVLTRVAVVAAAALAAAVAVHVVTLFDTLATQHPVAR